MRYKIYKKLTMNIEIRILTICIALIFIQENVWSQFYVQGGFSADNTSKEIDKLIDNKNKLVYRIGIGQEINIKKYFVLDAGVHLMNINKQTFDIKNQASTYNFALPVQLRVRPVKFFDIGIGIMPSVTSAPNQSIFKSPISYYGLVSLGINIHKSFTIEGSYNYGLKTYRNVSFVDENGTVTSLQDYNFQSFSLTAKVKF